MKNTQKGFIGIAIIVLIALVAVGGGAYVYTQNKVVQDASFEQNIVDEIETASSTGATTTVTVGVTSKTKTSVTAQVNAGGDIYINQEQLNKVVAEKYGDIAGVNAQIKARAQASFSSFVIEASMIQSVDGSYKNVCANAKSFIEADIKKSLAEDDGVMVALGITLNSYNTTQIVCKADADNFIITMPINLEDGSVAKVCSSATQLGFTGDANYETFTCIKK